MCGFLGAWEGTGRWGLDWLERGANAIRHRGPDDAGYWVDQAAGIALAHRRLSIVDLSPAGHQPMASTCGRWVIVFNGEIYNHLELRADLGPRNWRGHSDTETLLVGFERWGIRDTIERAVGMFAIAVWDREHRCLTLVRDRFGEKPLYFGWQAGVFLFGSELKALRAHPAWDARVDRRALALYMRHCAVGGEWSIYEGIHKLRPGSMLVLDAEVLKAGSLPEPQSYWRLCDVIGAGRDHPWEGSEAEAIVELERVLTLAVRGQMMSDVPLGAFLSGGVDSSTVVALMQAQSAQPVKTFTIGFGESAYNEAEYARAVAQHLGTEHTELYVTPQEAMAVIPSLGTTYDEPFADSSQIPTSLVAELARRHVTVALSGDAGDELFGGYNRYFEAARSWRRLSGIPLPLRRGATKLVGALAPDTWTRLLAAMGPVLPSALRGPLPGDKLYKAARALGAKTSSDLYRQLVTTWDPAEVVLGVDEPAAVYSGMWPGLSTLEEQMMAWDSVGYLPDDILVKVDRAAMAVSLEARVPLLDHRVAAFAWRLPLQMKIRGNVGKWALRQVLYRHVPSRLIERPKQGFGVPIDSWLRGALRDWAESLLDEGCVKAGGYFDAARVRQVWSDHLSGRRNAQHLLWCVLMFQQWLEACRND